MKPEALLIYAITAASIIFLGFLLIFRIFHWNLLYPKVTIASIPVGGLSLDQAENYLKQKTKEWDSRPLAFVYQDKTLKAAPNDLGIRIKTDEMIRKAFYYGHDQPIGIDLLVFARTLNFLKPYNAEAVAELDAEKFMRGADEAFKSLEEKKTNATVSYAQKKFAILPSKEGMEIDRGDLLEKLRARVLDFSAEPIELKLVKTFPDLEYADAVPAKTRAEKITSFPLALSYNDKTWKIPPENFAKWIAFAAIADPANPLKKKIVLDIDKETAENYLKALSKEINIEPVNAQLTAKGDKIEIFSLSQDGIELKINESIEKIKEAAANDKWVNDSPVPLVAAKKSPEITTESINNMGITSLIGTGTSNFAGSPKNRRYNLGLGAAKFHGVLIKSGEEFSFAKTLGPITKEAGYKAELVIKNGATVPELGGGLCQVSTTAFRAAIYSGLPITERQPHAYPVKYYNPQGMDSTVYPPHPDLRFVNDSPGYILIQTKIKGNILSFEFYGTDDGRKIKIRGPQSYDVKPDGSMKAVFYRDIYRDDKIIKTDTFRSVYKSPNLYPHINPLE